ncbi:3-ketoacyl-CoA synthase 10-like [Nymphaea colorata]|nr:3-ketoacyl-CoA synthase 10-like [Nymphaea colorata]
MAREEALLSPEITEQGVQATGPDAGSLSFSVRVRRRLPDFLQSIDLKYVKLGYHYIIKHGLMYLWSVVVLAVVLLSAEVVKLTKDGAQGVLDKEVLFLALLLVGLLTFVYLELCPRSIYLVDYACCSLPDEYKVSRQEFIELAKKSGNFDDTNLEFLQRTLKKSGIGDESYLPRHVISSPSRSVTIAQGREEAAVLMFGAVDSVLFSTKIHPRDITILVVNCGIFNVVPSLSAMLVNHYKMRSDIQTYNLGGMGCAAGAIAIDLARALLDSRPGTYALVVSTEIITATWYAGKDIAMLLPNCFLRMGATAVLLTNRRLDRWRAKYELKQLVRNHKAANDQAFHCVMQKEDDEKKKGLLVARDILEVGGQVLKDHITTLGPLVLPISEQIHFFSALVLRKGKSKPYIPDFKQAFEHVCVLACSKVVLDKIQKNLELTEEYMEASKMTLHKFGNTSSSSVWYELAYLEAKGRIKKGDRVWQISFGSGFKCNSVVWVALRNARKNENNPWIDCIGEYPKVV